MRLHRFPVHNISVSHLPKYLDAYIILRVTTQIEMVSNSSTPIMPDIRDVLTTTGVEGAPSLSHIENTTFIASKNVDKIRMLTSEGSFDSK